MDFDADDDRSCEYAYAMLLVSGDHIPLEEFTRLLGVSPTEAGIAGDCSCWKLSSEGQPLSKNLEAHVHWILDRIEGKQRVIRSLKQERNCQVDMGCAYKMRADLDDSGPFLSVATLRRIADFELNLIFYLQR